MPKPIRILFVDDEERILRSLALQFRRQFEVLTEVNPLRVLQRLQEQPVDIIVSDQRMPQMSGSQLLAQIQERHPQTLRILLTGYSDLDAATEALNSGGIFRYLTKPWDQVEMAQTLQQAAQLVEARRTCAVLELPAQHSSTHQQPVLLLLDSEQETRELTRQLCNQTGIRLLYATEMASALDLLNQQTPDILVSDIQLAGEDLRPLLMTLAQAHPRLLSIIVTPFQDTQVLLKLINQAQIFRYLPKPVRRGMLERALRTAAQQTQLTRQAPAQLIQRKAESPVEAEEQRRIGSLMGMLGRLRQRLIA